MYNVKYKNNFTHTYTRCEN